MILNLNARCNRAHYLELDIESHSNPDHAQDKTWRLSFKGENRFCTQA